MDMRYWRWGMRGFEVVRILIKMRSDDNGVILHQY
jgi:hypothetical protein